MGSLQGTMLIRAMMADNILSLPQFLNPLFSLNITLFRKAGQQVQLPFLTTEG